MKSSEEFRRRYRRHFVLAVIACVVFGSACGPPDTAAEPPAHVENAVDETRLATVALTEQAELRLGIETATVERRSIARVRALGGDVMVPPGRALTVSAPVAGTVLAPESGQIPRPGARVASGQVISRLVALPTEDDLLRVQQAVDVAEARLTNAQAKVTRAELLLQDSIITLAEYEDTQQEFTTAEAEARSARARLSLIHGDNRGDELSPLFVRAPTAGLVQQAFAAGGQSVAAGTPLFEVVATHPLWVRVPVYAGDLVAIDTDAPARVSALASPTGTDARTARPIPAPPSANAQAASIDLFYEVANPEGALRPGQRVIVEVNQLAREEGLTVPWSAVVYDIQGGAWVYEHLAEHTYARRRVEVRHVIDSLAVLARGPAEGTQVVSVGAAELFGTEFGADH